MLNFSTLYVTIYILYESLLYYVDYLFSTYTYLKTYFLNIISDVLP